MKVCSKLPHTKSCYVPYQCLNCIVLLLADFCTTVVQQLSVSREMLHVLVDCCDSLLNKAYINIT